MIRRRLNNEKCGCCCTLKEKLQYLWDHTMGAIKKVNEITPDGDGKFTVEAGTNIALTEISNGLRIDTTGGVSYYTAGDTYVDVDNNDLEISLKNPGQTGGVALHDDLEVVAAAVAGKQNTLSVTEETIQRSTSFSNGSCVIRKYGNVCVGHVRQATPTTTGVLNYGTAPIGYRPSGTVYFTLHGSASNTSELCSIDSSGTINFTIGTLTAFYGSFMFITN